jgi:hypothetical protein
LASEIAGDAMLNPIGLAELFDIDLDQHPRDAGANGDGLARLTYHE